MKSRSCEIGSFKLSHRFGMWRQAHRQQCCSGACQIPERLNYSKHRSRGFETSRDLIIIIILLLYYYNKTSYEILKRGPERKHCAWLVRSVIFYFLYILFQIVFFSSIQRRDFCQMMRRNLPPDSSLWLKRLRWIRSFLRIISTIHFIAGS